MIHHCSNSFTIKLVQTVRRLILENDVVRRSLELGWPAYRNTTFSPFPAHPTLIHIIFSFKLFDYWRYDKQCFDIDAFYGKELAPSIITFNWPSAFQSRHIYASEHNSSIIICLISTKDLDPSPSREPLEPPI